MTDQPELDVITADDDLLDRLGQGLADEDGDNGLAALLVDWRADIVDARETVQAVALVAATALEMPAPWKLRRRLPSRDLRPALTAAALIGVLSTLGVGGAASQATPDSVLFPLTRLVASEHAESVQARDDVRAALARADRQVATGDLSGARATLRDALSRCADVAPGDGRAALRARVREAQERLARRVVPSSAPTPSPPVATPPAVSEPARSPIPQSPSASAAPPAGPNPTPAASVTPRPAGADLLPDQPGAPVVPR